ncbi:hypothetical protein BXZ70DRAFT_1066280 [Cristinia sonorae]|uniref:F-box domain-containing protein n=1 Tax=Cristinia sonorae TaxID=1940300 RepID=A0A8K0ULI6_9AGAR|nr:hypothetical protein BXZ70DRAFT_1066280 [Cristinia sonorae]
MHSVNLLAFPLFERIQNFFNGPHPHVEKHEVCFTLMTPATPPKHSYAFPCPPYFTKHIPNEIVLRILEAACDPNDIPSTHAVLTNSALVSRDWSLLAQKLLFRRVSLRSQAAFNSLSDALSPSTPRGLMLADAVLSLRVFIDHNQPNAVSPHAFAHILQLCPRLQELDLSLFGRGAPGHDVVGSPAQARMQRIAPSFDPATLAMLRAGPSIRRLRFSNWTDNTTTLSQLLHIWPSVNALEIKGTPPTIPPTSSPFPCTLQELRVNCQTPPSLEFLRWSLRNSKGSLLKVQADQESCSEVLARVVREHHDTLQSVAIPTCPSREATHSVMQCQDLRHLYLEDARVPMVLCKTLPSTLQHIAFGVHRDTDMKPLLHLISEGTRLSSVTLHLWKNAESQNQLEAVRTACAGKGVKLDVVNDIREFRLAAAVSDTRCFTSSTGDLTSLSLHAALKPYSLPLCLETRSTETFLITTSYKVYHEARHDIRLQFCAPSLYYSHFIVHHPSSSPSSSSTPLRLHRSPSPSSCLPFTSSSLHPLLRIAYFTH